MLKRTIFYRGLLSSCNYRCAYCPFALQKNARTQLQEDKADLQKFMHWLSVQDSQTSYAIMFTPWGEALIRNYYQQAFVNLSHQANIHKVCAQTNLSGDIHWLDECCRNSSALWISYHPNETEFDTFIAKCQWLYQHHIRYSVGMVGLKESFPAMKELRKALAKDVYLWINAYKDKANYYSEQDIDAISTIDPYFRHNLCNYSSQGQFCQAGQQSLLLGPGGTLYRCHFITQPIANLYQDKLSDIQIPNTCPNKSCECYLGYIHLAQSASYEVYAEAVLERIPIDFQ